MRRSTVAAALGAATLALPSVNAWAAATATTARATPKKKVVTATKSFTGAPGSAGRWGDVQVTVVVKKTTTTNLTTRKKTVKRKITAVKVPLYPDHTDRSVFINQQALPILIQETVRTQSAAIDMISGATDSSDGFEQSLQAALVKVRAWK